MRIIERKQDVDLTEKVTVEMTLAELTTIATIFGGLTTYEVGIAVGETIANLEETNVDKELINAEESYRDIFTDAYEYLESKGVFK